MTFKIESIKIPFQPQLNKYISRVVFLASLFAFFILATDNLAGTFAFRSLDEYYKYQVALKFMRGFLGLDKCFDLSSLPTDPREPFLMYLEYVGWAPLYIAVGVMSVLGKAFGYFFSFRLSAVLCGMITLCSIWVVLRRWFCEWTAAFAVFFVGCNFSYIQTVAHGFFCEVIFQVFGLWFGLALCVTGHVKKKNFLLYAGFFVFGLTFWAKIMFLAYLFAAPVAVFALGRKRWSILRSVFSARRSVVLSCVSFLLGATPFIWFNLRHGFPTLMLVFSRMFNISQVHSDWNNSAVFANLLQRVKDFYFYLSGQGLFAGLNESFAFVYVALFCSALLWGIFTVFFRRGESRTKQRLSVLFAFYAVVFFLACFVPNRHRNFQILIMVPFSGILCALFLVNVGRIKNMLFLPVLICGLWFCEQFNYVHVFSRDYLQGGQFYGLLKGEPDFLAAWIDARNIKRILCSRPVGRIINFSTSTKAQFYDLAFFYASPDEIADDMRRFICEFPEQNSYMLIHKGRDFATHTKIKDSAEQYGIKVEVIDTRLLRDNPEHTFLLCRIFLS